MICVEESRESVRAPGESNVGVKDGWDSASLQWMRR